MDNEAIAKPPATRQHKRQASPNFPIQIEPRFFIRTRDDGKTLVIASPAGARQSSPRFASGAGGASQAAWIAAALAALAMTGIYRAHREIPPNGQSGLKSIIKTKG